MQPAQALALARELKRSGVVKNEDGVMRAAASGRHVHVRTKNSTERDIVVVQEPIERLELSLRAHGFGEAPGGMRREPLANALEPCAPPLVTERRPSKFLRDVCQHGTKRSRPLPARNEIVWDP